MMMVEPDGVLFAGDIVQNGRIPFMNADDVETTKWLPASARSRSSTRNSSFPATAGPSTHAKPRSPSPATTYLYRAPPWPRPSQSWTEFDAAYDATDWSKYQDIPAFAANNRGNAYRIFLEMERAQFKADKPGQ